MEPFAMIHAGVRPKSRLGRGLTRRPRPTVEVLEGRELLSLSPFTSFSLKGDYVAAGVGLRGRADGMVTVAGIPANSTVRAAYLYYGYVVNAETPALRNITFAGTAFAGQRTGAGPDPSQPPLTGSVGYRADVTAKVAGNGNYAITNVANGPTILAEGATLVVVYANDTLPNRQVLLYDGDDVTNFDNRTRVNTFDGFQVAAPASARTTFIVGDGQAVPDINSFTGSRGTLTLDNAFRGADGTAWDTATFDVSEQVAAGDTSVSASLGQAPPDGDSLMWVAQVLSVTSTGMFMAPQVNFLDNNDAALDPRLDALNVSNFVTTTGLPATSAFADTVADPDNFRLQVNDPNRNVASVSARLEVIRGGVTQTLLTYDLDQKQGTTYRGQFLRLVTDTQDEAVSGKQTIRVQLGDIVRIRYDAGPNQSVIRDLMVGRPGVEDDNGANQLRNDIRVLRLNIVVFRNAANTAPIATTAQVMADIASANERLAQSTIRIGIAGLELGAGDAGVALPAGAGINFANGFDAETIQFDPARGLTAEERAIFARKDADPNTVDVFYTPDFSAAAVALVGPRARSYPASFSGGNALYINNVAVTGRRGTLSLPHELMHILLNAGHRANEPATSLFTGGTTDKRVNGTKRIGPNSDTAGGVGNNDTRTIRANAETLPRFVALRAEPATQALAARGSLANLQAGFAAFIPVISADPSADHGPGGPTGLFPILTGTGAKRVRPSFVGLSGVRLT